MWINVKIRLPKKPNSYRNNTLPVPTPVLTGSGSLGPSLKRSQAVKPPQGVLILQSSAHYTMRLQNLLVELGEAVKLNADKNYIFDIVLVSCKALIIKMRRSC